MKNNLLNILFLLLASAMTCLMACPSECQCGLITVCHGGNYLTLPDNLPSNLVSLKWSNLKLFMLNNSGPLAKHRFSNLRTLELNNLTLAHVSAAPFLWTQLSQLHVSGCCFSRDHWPSLSMHSSNTTTFRLLRVNMPCANSKRYHINAAALPSHLNFLDLANSSLISMDANVWLNQTDLSAVRLDDNLFQQLDFTTLNFSPSTRSRLQLRNLHHIKSVRMYGQHIFELDLRGSKIPADLLNCSAVQLYVGHQPAVDVKLLLRHFCFRLERISVSFTNLKNYSHDMFLKECPQTARLFIVQLNNVTGITKFPKFTSRFQLKSLEVTWSNLKDDSFRTYETNASYLLNAAVINLNANQLERPLFKLTKDVIELSIANNRLQDFQISWLALETAGRIMNKLNFSANPMKQIFNDVYRSLDNVIKVRKLVMENIDSVRKKGEFPKELFRAFSNVRELFLGENKLRNLTNLLRNLQTFAYQETLERLYLQKNEFTVLEQYQFLLLNKVKRLDISHNNIKVVHENAFSGVDSLLYVDLSGNQLISLVALFSRLPSHIRTLRIINNPLNCECYTSFRPRNFTTSLQLHAIDAFCAVPLKAAGLNYMKFVTESNESVCDNDRNNNSNSIDERWQQVVLYGLIGVLGIAIFVVLIVLIVNTKAQSFIYTTVHPCLIKKTSYSSQLCNKAINRQTHDREVLHPLKLTTMPDVCV